MKKVLIATAALLLSGASAIAQQGNGQGGRMMDGGWGWGMGGGYGWMLPTILILLVVVVLVLVMRRK